MSDPNLGFSGTTPNQVAPLGFTISNNIALAVAYQNTHTAEQTYNWFRDVMRNNSDGHLPWNSSMDYKQLGAIFQDFGNFNYGAVGRALGYSDQLLTYAAGTAQQQANGKGLLDAIAIALSDLENRGDNPGDRALVEAGIAAARGAGNNNSSLGLVGAAKYEYNNKIGEEIDKLILRQQLNDAYENAKNQPIRIDPLTLDLDGDGIETIGINANNNVLFDHDGDGAKHGTGWVSADDAMLVLDRNNNGTIDNGRELFGDNTQLANGRFAADGFAALAELDINGGRAANDATYFLAA